MSEKILIGYDASPDAKVALDWALDEAARSGASVRLEYGFEWLAVRGWLGPGFALGAPPDVGVDAQARQQIAELLEETLATARADHPGLTITAEILDGPPVARLLDSSAGATMLVLGSRGHGGFTGLLTGSTTTTLTAHAHCPVVVVREAPSTPDGPIMVGVDGSDHSVRALRFAAEHAAARGLPLRVIRVLPAPDGWPGEPDPAVVVGDARTELADLVARSLAAWSLVDQPDDRVRLDRSRLDRSAAAGPQVSTEVVIGAPAEALIERSRTTSLTVVGTRGRGGFTGLLLGSVSQQLLHHAHCPVVVVREPGEPA